MHKTFFLFLKLEYPESLIVRTIELFLVESIVSCRPVKEGFMDITAIIGVIFGMLAIVTILFVLIYFGRKKE